MISISTSSRLRLLSLAVLFFSCVCLVRLYHLQVVQGPALTARAQRQYGNVGEEIFDRGTIYFTNKDTSLWGAAKNKPGFALTINPTAVKDANALYKALNALVPLDRESFLAKAQKENDSYEEITKEIDQKTADRIIKGAFAGVSVRADLRRTYPGGNSASHVLGFVGYKDDTLSGRYGLEQYYDYILKRDGADRHENSFAEIFSNIKEIVSPENAREGDIVTAVEPEVEAYIEKELGQFMATWKPEQVGAIVMDPSTGEIVALAGSPGFDPNTFQKEKDSSVFVNHAVESVYEMGSIMKPITIASSIDAGAINRNSTFHDKGFIEIDGKKISNVDHRDQGIVSMQEVLNQSLNTGAIYAEQKMGNEAFRLYLEKFGIGDETGIDLPGEAGGLVKNLESKRDVEFATASFGQGVAISPISMTRALAALANGGIIVTPHLATKIRYADGSEQAIKFEEHSARVIKESTAKTITEMLTEVVDTALLKGTVKMKHYGIAAKTGTAQIAKKEGGGYYDDKFLHSFFGYFPASKPRFIVFLYAVNPKGASFASGTLTMPFIDIAKYLINYYNILPDR